MNKLVLTLAIAMVGFSAFAQQAGVAGPGRKPGGARMIKRLAPQNKEILSQLNLTADQQKKIDDLNATTKDKLQKLAAELKASKADKDGARDKVRGAMKDYRTAVEAILNADQKKKYAKLLRDAREKRKEKQKDGQPNG